MVFFLLSLHGLFTYIALFFVKEEQITANLVDFFYWFLVSISTVGYGDISPSTDLGKLIVSFWVLPFGLVFFAFFIGKLSANIFFIWNKIMHGDRDFTLLENHIVLLGWRKKHTKKLIDLILADKMRKKRKILLAVSEEMTHPFMDSNDVLFVKLDSYTDQEELKRTGLLGADKIIIDCQEDSQTLAVSLSVISLTSLIEKTKQPHISAYFQKEETAILLRTTYPKIEISSSIEAQMLSRSMQDPGSTRVINQIVSTLDGQTQFSILVPDFVKDLTLGDLFFYFKEKLGATIVALANNSYENNILVNPPLKTKISPRQIIYYLSLKRLDSNQVDFNRK